MNTKIKICGITNLSDALYVSQLGVDAIGFVFYKDSPRSISLEKASMIAYSMPPFMTKVGLFVNPDEETVHEVIDANVIDIIQYHGDERAKFCEAIEFPYIKVIKVKESGLATVNPSRYRNASAFLLDTYDPASHGGTGQAFDWSLIDKHELNKPIILAGGLNSQNIEQAILQVGPYAVDVSSGVESSPGKKDKEKLHELVNIISNVGQHV